MSRVSCVSLPEQGASFVGLISPTTGVQLAGIPCTWSLCTGGQGFDLESAVRADQFYTLSFREGLDLGDREDEPAPIAG